MSLRLRLPIPYDHIRQCRRAVRSTKEIANFPKSRCQPLHYIHTRTRLPQIINQIPSWQAPFQGRLTSLVYRLPHGMMSMNQSHLYTTNLNGNEHSLENQPSPKPKSSAEKIKVILKEYGSVALVFHISVSLCSVGTCYILVSNGLDVDKVLDYFNVGATGTKKGASTFAIAYVLHKCLLPFRAAITVACVPLIVRKMRSMGLMKGMVNTVKDTASKNTR